MAAKAWMILVSYATHGQPITYQRLAELVGMGQTANTITNNAVIYVMAYCVESGLPPLNSIVCNRHKGEPGHGIPNWGPLFDVFDHDWYDVCPPTPKALRDARQAWSARQ